MGLQISKFVANQSSEEGFLQNLIASLLNSNSEMENVDLKPSKNVEEDFKLLNKKCFSQCTYKIKYNDKTELQDQQY